MATSGPIRQTTANYTVKQTIYELAFHLNPDLEEKQVLELTQNIENHIASIGGVVSFKKAPERTRLSYPIKHKRQAYFGFIHFNLESLENLSKINENLSNINDVWRYMIIKIPATPQKVKFRFKPSKPKTADNVPEKQTPEQSKEMEKKLEGILENL